MVAEPVCLARATPLLRIFAIRARMSASSLRLAGVVLPLLKCPIATNCCTVRGATVGFTGETEFDVSETLLTVSVADPEIAPKVAVTKQPLKTEAGALICENKPGNGDPESGAAVNPTPWSARAVVRYGRNLNMVDSSNRLGEQESVSPSTSRTKGRGKAPRWSCGVFFFGVFGGVAGPFTTWTGCG
jgi:hypothetical protein